MNSDKVLLKLWSGHRQLLLTELAFYHEQSVTRLLKTFSNLEKEAEDFAEKEYARLGQFFDPDMHDPDDLAETAHDRGIDFYGLLEGLRDRTILSIVAGMYHEWEKQLRDWVDRELLYSFKQGKLREQIWKVDIEKLFEFFNGCGWRIKDQSFFKSINSCRLLVNVYKHGMGPSFNELKTHYPLFLKKIVWDIGAKPSDWIDFTDHTHLAVTSVHIDEFYNGFKEFWEFVPEGTMISQMVDIPKWFKKAIE